MWRQRQRRQTERKRDKITTEKSTMHSDSSDKQRQADTTHWQPLLLPA